MDGLAVRTQLQSINRSLGIVIHTQHSVRTVDLPIFSRTQLEGKRENEGFPPHHCDHPTLGLT
jgi:hypothetical protein